MNRRQIILVVLITFLLGVFVGNKLNNQVKRVEVQQLAPECYLGICPRYQSLDVDGDGQAESVAVVPTRMTKGAGRVWVIKRGKVVFISQEYAEIGVKWLESNNGFILVHQELLPLGDLGPVIEQKYFYKNGTFIKHEP